MKHSYNVACGCPRCGRERARRQAQADRDATARVMARMRRPSARRRERVASLEEQHGRYLDAGPGAWDDRDD